MHQEARFRLTKNCSDRVNVKARTVRPGRHGPRPVSSRRSPWARSRCCRRTRWWSVGRGRSLAHQHLSGEHRAAGGADGRRAACASVVRDLTPVPSLRAAHPLRGDDLCGSGLAAVNEQPRRPGCADRVPAADCIASSQLANYCKMIKFDQGPTDVEIEQSSRFPYFTDHEKFRLARIGGAPC